MDPITPKPATPQPDDGLIMPDQPDVQVTAEPIPIPVSTPAPAAPVEQPQPAVPTPEVTPAPTPVPEADPLFAPVTEPDPLEATPAPVAPTPAAPVTDQAMKNLDDGVKPVVIASTGQTVIAKTEKPHKSRRKTMVILIIGLLVLGGVGFAAYKYFMKPNVVETQAPATLAVDQLSPENLAQATDKGEAHTGLVAPLGDVQTNCAACHPADTLDRAWKELFIAEGSDWFWWFGDDHSSAQDDLFDQLFRKHLQNVYTCLGHLPPVVLSKPITRMQRKIVHTDPKGFLKVKVDGRRTYFEWINAGHYISGSERGISSAKRS